MKYAIVAVLLCLAGCANIEGLGEYRKGPAVMQDDAGDAGDEGKD